MSFEYPNTKFSRKGTVKEVFRSITTPEAARLALIFVPVGTSGEATTDLQKKVAAIWSWTRREYRERFVTRDRFKGGELVTTVVTPEVWVVQGICLNAKDKLDKEAIEPCVRKLVELAKYESAYVHVTEETLQAYPGLAKALNKEVPEAGLNLYVYKDAPPAA